MLTYEKIRQKPRCFRVFTGLDENEFKALLISFNDALEIYIQETCIDGQERQRAYGGGRKPILSTNENKLLFILFYYKIYPIQEVMALLFGMSQGQVCHWIHKLSDVLRIALGYENLLPERKAKNMKEILESCKELSFILDGVERRIQRPKDPTIQKEYYSGKKKPTRSRII